MVNKAKEKLILKICFFYFSFKKWGGERDEIGDSGKRRREKDKKKIGAEMAEQKIGISAKDWHLLENTTNYTQHG